MLRLKAGAFFVENYISFSISTILVAKMSAEANLVTPPPIISGWVCQFIITMSFSSSRVIFTTCSRQSGGAGRSLAKFREMLLTAVA